MLWEVDIKALAVIIWYCLALHIETVVNPAQESYQPKSEQPVWKNPLCVEDVVGGTNPQLLLI